MTPDRIRDLSRNAHPFIRRALELIPGIGAEMAAADEYVFTLLQIPGSLETLIELAKEHGKAQEIPRFKEL